MAPSSGRPPAENPKSVIVKARIDADTAKLLDDYCAAHGKTRTDVLREGIQLVLGQKGK